MFFFSRFIDIFIGILRKFYMITFSFFTHFVIHKTIKIILSGVTTFFSKIFLFAFKAIGCAKTYAQLKRLKK